MTPLPALIIGLALPACTGWLIVRLIERSAAVLSWPERLGYALLLGPVGTLWLTDLVSIWTGMPLTLWSILVLQLGFLGLSAGLIRWQKIALFAPSAPIAKDTRRWLVLGLGILLAISVLKLVLAGSVLTLNVPTFFDDARDNWNLRAKVIVETHQIPVQMPGEDGAGGGVASYPSTLPLLKAWLVFLAGDWSEALVNSVQSLWLVIAGLLVGGSIARRRGSAWGLAAVVALLGLPLVAIHALHSYGDLMVAAAIAAVVLAFFEADRAESREGFFAWLALGIAGTALFPALKNEGLAVFFPSGLLLLGFVLWRSLRRGDSERSDAMKALLGAGLAIAVTTLPWLVFKWAQGLTFGNAHAIGETGFGWQSGVLSAIAYHLFSEGNWLLLPGLALVLLALRRRLAFGPYIVLTISCLWVFASLSGLFLVSTDLGHEALKQTGYGRAMVQVSAVWTMLVCLLLPDPREAA